MARSAFTGGLFPTLLNHVGPLQGAWGHWGALIRLHGVSGCCQRPSRPTMSTVAVSVPYWGHTAAVCLLVATTVSAYHVDCGCFCALLGTHCCCLSPCGWYNPPSAPHPPPPPTPPPSRPPTPYKLYP